MTAGTVLTGISLVVLTLLPVKDPSLSMVRIGVGILYLRFVPEYVLLQSLDTKLAPLQLVIYGVGVSLVYDVILALVVNFLLRAVGIPRPLDPIPIVTALVASVFVLYFVGLRRGSFARFAVERFGQSPVYTDTSNRHRSLQ